MKECESLEFELSQVDFSLPGTGHLREESAGFSFAARAFSTKSRRSYRFASSELRLREILPDEISEGEAWHVISSGDIDSLSFVANFPWQLFV